MNRLAVVVVLLLGACVADDPATPPVVTPIRDVTAADIDVVDIVEQDADAGLCALAADLPPGNLCSLICDPGAFKARLLDGGMKGGNCYQVRCDLSPEISVTVGVCLPQ